MKHTFAAKTFAAHTFRSGTFTGVGVDVSNVGLSLAAIQFRVPGAATFAIFSPSERSKVQIRAPGAVAVAMST